jgi:triacylglycerol lipase
VHPLLWLQLLGLAAGAAMGLPGLLGYSCAVGGCCARFRADLAAPPGPGYLSIYSRRDGVVDWRACLDPHGRQQEVDATHCGMASDRVVAHLVARALDGFAAA